MRQINYRRHEFRHYPEKRTADLFTLVYDIPYFGACGIFPPLHIINEIFASGGSDGGMSPGAIWQPFTIDEPEYNELVTQVKTVVPKMLGDQARYNQIPFEFDQSFDYITSWSAWLSAVCNKHRLAYHQKTAPS